MAITSAPNVANRARLSTEQSVGADPLARLPKQPRALGPVIPLPWVELEETTRANFTQSGLRA
jgi:hypothetical protein